MSFQMDDADIDFTDTLIFKHREIVRMRIKDCRENAARGTMFLKCDVLTGEHGGKETEIMITIADNAASKKRRAQFAQCFLKAGVWSRDQLKAGQADLKALLGRTISVRSNVRDGKEGQIFQNWDEFQDEGLAAPAPGASPGAAVAANTSF